LRLQRDEERFSDAAMRLFSDFDERKAGASVNVVVAVEEEGTKTQGLLGYSPPKLTWKLKIIHLKRKLIFRTFVFGVPC